MPTNNLEERLAALEAEVDKLKAKLKEDQTPWTAKIWGAFRNDPMYEEAMALGRKWRESFRPKSAKKGKRNGRSRHRSRKPAGQSR
jgi:hypothetical protein